jgi:PAS domain S-box-containing protein
MENTPIAAAKNINEFTAAFLAKDKRQTIFSLFLHNEHAVFFAFVLAIFICEMSIMLFISYMPAMSTSWGAIVDATALSVLLFPVIYYFLVKPLKVSIAEKNSKELRYSTLVENIGEGVVICNSYEEFMFANAAAEKLFGIEKGKLIGDNFNHFLSSENFEMIVQQTCKRKNGEAGFYETIIIQKNGDQKNVLITATPQFENGHFKGTLAVFSDITELKKAEAAITYERNLLRALIDNLPDAVYVKDKQFRKIIANPVDLKYMGLTSESEAAGKSDFDIYSSDIANSSFADDQYVFETGLPYINKEDYFVDNLNQEHWMLNSKVPIKDATGAIIGLVGIGREITDRKKEETRLKLLESVITNTTDAVAITTIEKKPPYCKIIYINNAYTKMTGYSLEEVAGKSPAILQGPKTDKAELRRIGDCLKRFEPCTMEVINYKKNGEEFWSSISLSPIADKSGIYTHWIAIKRDTTEGKILEKNYINAKEKAEAASKAKSEFLANMSHEIRTPLNSVIGFSDLLLKTNLDETQQQYTSTVYQSANSLLDIINEILDFSKIEAGKLEIEVDKTDLLELGSHVSDVISYQAYRKNLELLLNISPDIPRFVWIDPIRLRQILVNLMGNAVKFTSVGEIELKIDLVKTEPDNQSVIRFSVRDTGIGIMPENQEKVFEAFSQEDASTNRKYGGTGLGLAISKKLLELMGSQLQLESTPTIGSTFFFDLTVETMQGEPEELTDIIQFKNVLIVDDNANNRLLLKKMMALKGIQCEEAETGPVALKMIAEAKKYDLVLMDFNMPEMDGIETVSIIRNELKLSAAELAVILLHSSAEDESLNAACNKLDVAKRLVKPIRRKNLYETMSRVGAAGRQDKVNNLTPDNFVTNTGIVKVLVADDNAFNILLISKVLAKTLPNAIILEAKNGREALDLYQQELPDIVFMDIQMPDMNGHEATMAIRLLEKDKKVPIIALTAGTFAEEKELCLGAGMDDFVTKPFVLSTIVAVLNKWL